jgi:hypothetical protein
LNHKSLIRFLGDYVVKHINQNSSLQEGQTYTCTTWFTIGHFCYCLFFNKTRNILFTGIWVATRPMIFHHKTFRYNMSNWSSSKLNHKSLIRFLGDYIVKHINQNSSLHEGLSLYLAGLFSNPETVKMRLRSTELSMSEHSIREKSLNWVGVSYRAFNIAFFPIF